MTRGESARYRSAMRDFALVGVFLAAVAVGCDKKTTYIYVDAGVPLGKECPNGDECYNGTICVRDDFCAHEKQFLVSELADECIPRTDDPFLKVSAFQDA